MGDTTSVLASLEAQYCPPLDTALLSAILSDYDLKDESNLKDARAALDQLKESAQLEEHLDLGFDPSGTGAGVQELARDLRVAARPESCPGTETNESTSRETDLTSLSNELNSLDFDRRSEGDSILGDSDIVRELDKQDPETKVELLEQILDNRIGRSQITHTLKKCDGSFERAVDELLNHVHFGEIGEDGTKVSAKGIDAFAEEHVVKRGRKRKARRKNLESVDERRSGSLPTSPVSASASASNAWQGSSKDIEFIASRAGMPSAKIASIYYKNGASIPKTVGELLTVNLEEGTKAIAEDPIKAVNAHELHLEFPNILYDHVAALVHLTYPSTAAAHDLAKALTDRPAEHGGIQIIPTYRRMDFDVLDSDTAGTSSRRSRNPGTALSYEDYDTSECASAYASARSAALAQAYAAHRRAKSDRLMGGAAAYYGQEYRNFTALSLEASAAVANQRAAAQSTASQLDLHGVDVQNAVRIAEAKVEQWWEQLGEARVNGRVGAYKRHAGYEVVVGRGTHSEGGRSKLGPAVSKALKNAGWKIELDGPLILVKGRVR